VRAFVVRLPSGVRYWTVIDEDLRVNHEADEFLRHPRFGRGCAESTTRAYATAAALYLLWCRQVRRDWRDAATGWERSCFGFATHLDHARR
jgi:hypothetical protein